MRKPFFISLLVLLAICIVSCKPTPSWVIDKNDMENLLIDIHLSEALIQDNPESFRTEEKRDALYEAILKKHKVTRQQVDTSLYWYGQHIELYNKIYQKVTFRLNADKGMMENILLAESFVLIQKQKGDTMNIWNEKMRYAFVLPQINNVLSFEIETDTSFHVKDSYELRMNLSGIIPKDSTNLSQASLMLKYKKDSFFVVRKDIDANGHFSLKIESEKLVPKKILGSILIKESVYPKSILIDNIQLLRIHEEKKNEAKTDSINQDKKPEQKKDLPISPRIESNRLLQKKDIPSR